MRRNGSQRRFAAPWTWHDRVEAAGYAGRAERIGFSALVAAVTGSPVGLSVRAAGLSVVPGVSVWTGCREFSAQSDEVSNRRRRHLDGDRELPATDRRRGLLERGQGHRDLHGDRSAADYADLVGIGPPGPSGDPWCRS